MKKFIFALVCLVWLCVPAHAQTKVAAKVTTAQATANPLLLLQTFTETDLNAALADAQAQTPPDAPAVTCYTAVLAIVKTNVANPLPTTAGAFSALQKARDAKAMIGSLQAPNGPLAVLNNACAPLVMDAQNTLIALGVAVGLIANPITSVPVAAAGLPAAIATFLALPKL